MLAPTGQRSTRPRAPQLTAWFGLALGSLLLAGLFSFLLVLGRMPPFSELLPYPAFFRRCLVVHVDLALIVWFYAATAGLLQFLPVNPSLDALHRWSPAVSIAGVLAMVTAIFIPTADPVLANYVPVLDDPVFLAGLGLFAAGLLGVIASRRFGVPEEADELATQIPGASQAGLWAAAVALVTAVATVGVAWSTTSFGLDPKVYFERLFWGGGHALQVASVCAMLAVWIALLSSRLERPVLDSGVAAGLFAWLVLPHLASPFLALEGTTTWAYLVGPTRLMQFGIFPPVVTMMVLIGLRLRKARWADPNQGWFDLRLVGVSASIGLTVIGFLVGASIDGSSTTIPAHYHASIGAVTVAFMTFGLHLLEVRGHEFAHPGLERYVPWQPLLFGFGQLVFVVGFALAGASGMGRKLFGSDQVVLGWSDYLGLVVMGAGGIAAIAGGFLFLGLVADRWLTGRPDRSFSVDRPSTPSQLHEETDVRI